MIGNSIVSSPNPRKCSPHWQRAWVAKELVVCWYLFVIWILASLYHGNHKHCVSVILCVFLCGMQVKPSVLPADQAFNLQVWSAAHSLLQRSSEYFLETNVDDANKFGPARLSNFDYLCRRSKFLSGMFQPHCNTTSLCNFFTSSGAQEFQKKARSGLSPIGRQETQQRPGQRLTVH